MEEKTVAAKLEEVERLLDEYENRIGLGKITLKEPDWSITREVLLHMSAEDINTLRWEYNMYALALQKELNKHASRYYWADTNLKRYCEQYADQYEGWKWEERLSKVVNENTYAQKLHKLKLDSKMVLERTNFLCNKIHFLSDIAKDIYYSKRKQDA